MSKIAKPWISKEEFEAIQGGNWTPTPHTHVKVDITDTPWVWADVSKADSNLTDLATRQHAGLTDITHSQHHNKTHALTGVTHTAAGLTIGWVIKATGATTFAWGQLPHDKLAGLGDDDHTQYLLASGARALTGNWDAGGFQIRALKFYSDQATGTAPLTVLSTTKVTNLNADLWDGHHLPALVAERVLTTLDGVNLSWWQANFNWLSDLNLGSLEEGETIAYDQATAKWIDAWGVEYDNPRLVWKMYTDFFSNAVDANDPWVGAIFGGDWPIARAGTSNHPGIVRLAADEANAGVRFMTSVNCIRIAGGEHSEFCFKTGASLLSVRVRLGFQDSTTTTTPTDGIYIDISNLTLTGKTRNNGSGSTTGSYTISPSTWYRAKIAVNSGATSVTFILYSAAGTQLWSQTLSTNIPTASGRETGHGVVMWVATAVARYFDLDMMIATRAGYITR